MKKKLPPFGRKLVTRLQFNHPPCLIIICVGMNSWENAKKWNRRDDNCALVLPGTMDPEDLDWPVSGLICVVDWNTGPDEQFILRLVKILLIVGACTVVVRLLFVDHAQHAFFYDTSRSPGERWVQEQEIIRVYHNPLLNQEAPDVT